MGIVFYKMIEFIKKIISRFRKSKIVEVVIPVLAKEKTITEIFQEGKCPDCGVWEFLEGPCGGMSMNIKCENCGSFFNDSGSFGLERIRWVDHQLHRFDTAVQFKPSILKWKMVSLKNSKSNEEIDEIYNWCHEHTENKWCVKSGVPKSGGAMDERQTFYFKDPNDAMKFKIVWI